MSAPTPIPFITEDPRRPSHFTIDPAAANLLNSIKGPICPVVVAGPYRSGKSTLLNLLLPPSSAASSSSSRRATSGFAIGSTVQACTKGIWLWGEPVRVGNKTVLFLDSEGLGSIGKEQTFDVQIFSLSILLASLFLLNTTGTISESALEQLELVVQMTERVRAKDNRASSSNNSTSKEDELHALAAHFPDFLWVLRDFSLQLEDASGSAITPRQYLEHALQPVPGARSAEKNRIRHVLSTVFPARDCVPLVRPVTDEKALQRMASLDVKDLRGEFRGQMEALRNRVVEQVRPKTVEGVMVTGAAYLSLANAYVQAINGGTVPVIHSAWTAVVELQAKKAMEDAHASFRADLKQLSASLHPAAELTKALDAASVKAHQVLSDTAVGDVEHVDRLRKQLNEWIREEGEQVRELNAQRSREHNLRVWTDVWKRQKGDSVVEEADDETAWGELEARVVSEYNKQAKGEGREEVVRGQLAERRDRMMTRVMQRRLEERRQLTEARNVVAVKNRKVAELEGQIAKLDKQVAKLELELESERRTRSDDKRRVEEVERRAEEERKRAERQIADVKEQLKEAQNTEKDRQRAMQESQTRGGRLEAEVKESQAKNARLEAELKASESKMRKVEEEAKAKESEVRRLRDDVKEAAERERRVEGGSKEKLQELERVRAELSRERKERESEVRRLQQELKEAATRVERAEGGSKEGQEELLRLRGELSRERKEKTVLSERYRENEEELRLERESKAALLRTTGAAGKRIDQLSEDLSATRDEKSALQQQLDSEKQRVGVLNQELREAERSRSALREELSTLRRQVEYEREEKSSEDGRSKKRKLDEADEEKDVGMPPLDDHDHTSPPASPNPSSAAAFLPPPPRPSTTANNRRSLAPTRRSDGSVNTSTDAQDPNTLTVQELKSWLTELDVLDKLSMQQVAKMKKDDYVALVYKELPELEETFPMKVAAGKKGRKGK